MQQVETAEFFPVPVAAELTGELICYGRSVIHAEWPRAEEGTQADEVNPWGVEMFRTVQPFEPSDAAAGDGARQVARPDVRP